MLRTVTTILVLLVLAGCAHLEARRQANELQLASQDHAACVARGLHYPGADYVSCRYGLQNTRALRQVKCLEMAQMAANPRPALAPGCEPPPASREALERGRFECWVRAQLGNDYILCGERGR